MDLQPSVSREMAEAACRLGDLDILVAIPAFNNESTVAKVMKTAAEGLSTFFRPYKTAIFVCDGGSLDETKSVARNTDIGLTVRKIVATYRGSSGKGNALRGVFYMSQSLGARALVMLDADLRSVTPDWIHNLADPVLSENYDLVTPFYKRYKYDGTITNVMVYPIMCALFGKRIRQPIGGDFGVSKKLIDFFANHDVWDQHVGQFGIDIWMTVSALAEGFKICQASLGAKVHDAKDPAFSLGPMYMHVLSTLFRGMCKYGRIWTEVDTFEDVEVKGTAVPWEPEPIPISVTRLVSELKLGLNYFGPLYERILETENYERLMRLAGPGASIGNAHEFYMPQDLWARTVYDLAVTFTKWEGNTHKLIDLSSPLYFGKVASIANKTMHMESAEAEEYFIEDAMIFEELKPYLTERWKTISS